MTPSVPVDRLKPFATTIFAEMSQLAADYDAVNLGQGFPNYDGPAAMLVAAQQAIADGQNQYPPGPGIAPLRRAIAWQQLDRYGLSYDPADEVLVTVGATEAIAAALLATVQTGDEVVLLEPYYDSYAAVVALAGATRRVVPLLPADGEFTLDRAAFAAAITERTKAIVLNSPHNPTGKVFDRDDLEFIAGLCREYDLLAITDEVYEYLTFDGHEHISLASVPGMRERTLRISSAAKTFNCTGWKVGWVSGPRELVTAVRTAKQFLTYVGSGPLQPAVALALSTEADWVTNNAAALEKKRNQLGAALTELGAQVHLPQGGYFILADLAPLGVTDAVQWCRDAPAQLGVAAIPVSAFTDDAAPWRSTVRFTFAKTDAVIAAGGERLRAGT